MSKIIFALGFSLLVLLSGNTMAGPTLTLAPIKFYPPVFLLLPDLIVSDFHTTGPVTVRTDGFQEVPVRVVIENQGNGVAGKFRVSVRYITSQGDFMRPFTVDGQSSLWRPVTMASLFPGEMVAIEGKLVGYPSSSGETVDFYIKADSCDGDEFMPDYCRVRESNETNNNSELISVYLP